MNNIFIKMTSAVNTISMSKVERIHTEVENIPMQYLLSINTKYIKIITSRS